MVRTASRSGHGAGARGPLAGLCGLVSFSLITAGLVAPADASPSVVVSELLAAGAAAEPGPSAGSSEPLTAPDAVTARVIARLEGRAVEVVGERWERGSVFALPDGTMATGVAAGPVWVRQGGDGTAPADWARVDPSLRDGGDGTVRPVAHPAQVVLSGAVEADSATALVPVLTVGSAGAATSIMWTGDLPTPRLEGARAVYEDVRPGVDLVVDVTTTGVEQYFVVRDREGAEAAASLTLVVRSDDGQLQAAADGALQVKSDDGRLVARIPQPRMWDAVADADRVHPVTAPWEALPDDGSPVPPSALWQNRPRAQSAPRDGLVRSDVPSLDADAPLEGEQAPVMADQEPVEVEATPVADGVSLELTAGSGFLSDPDTTFPVVIDPEISLTGGFDTSVQSNVSYDMSTGAELLVGSWNSGATVTRSFINVDPAPIRGKHVIGALLALMEPYSYSCQARNWEVWDTTPASTSTRWSAQPAWWAKYATSSQTKGYSASCPGGMVTAEITTLAQRWADSAAGTTFGVGLKAENETDSYAWKRFYAADSGQGPWVWVNYNSVPSAPTSLTVSPIGPTYSGTRWVSTRAPRFSAVVSDADGGNVTATFQLLRNGVPQIEHVAAAVPSGSAAYWDLPSGTLQDGVSYSFIVKASDGTDTTGWQTYSPSFQVDVNAPLAPTVASTLYLGDGSWNGAENQAGTFTMTPAASDASLVSYRWALDNVPDPNQTITASTTGQPSNVSVTPTTSGRHVLQVQAVDRAGNTSSVVKYAFNVGRAGIVSPEDSARVVRRTRLFVTGEPGFTHLRFQWRRGPDSTTVVDVPTADLTTADGQGWAQVVSNGWAALPTGATGYTAWDVGATLGHEGGPLQVRALLATSDTGTDQYATAWITLTVDPDATGAASTDVGPLAVNLLTGDAQLSVTDAEEFGLSVIRTASSRDTDAGYELQLDKLTTAQQQASSTTGFTAGKTTLATATDHYHTGGSALSTTPTSAGTTGDTFAAIGGDTGAMRLGLQAGRTYRLSGWVYVPRAAGQNPLTPANSRALKLAFFAKVNGSYDMQTNDTTGAGDPLKVNTWQRVTLDVTVPTGATEAFVRAYNGYSYAQGQVVYWDDLSVRELWSPFGPQWDLGTADANTGTAYTRISRPYDDVAAVHLTGGGEIYFSSGNGTQWWPQPGAEGLKLTQTSETTWRLTELDGTVTDFTRNEATKDYPVTATSPPGAAATTTASPTRYVYDVAAVPGVSRLARIIAPVEPGVDGWPGNAQACTTATPARGCEVLDLTYATTTTATSSTFGSYAGRVSGASVWSWDPEAATPAMTTTPVAAYAYDTSGRLREVHDPRISPALATTYTYDTAGRITTITPAGELAHRFTYGQAGATTTGTGDFIDPNPGRLLQVTRASLQPGTTDQAGPDNVTTVVYGVPLARSAGGPYDLTPTALATWAQTDAPTDATAVFGPQDPPGLTTATSTAPGADGYDPATVHYLNASGYEVNTASPAAADTPVEGLIDTAEYDRYGNTVRTLDATNRLLALKVLPNAQAELTAWGLQTKSSAELAQLLDARTTYSDDGIEPITELAPIQRLAVANDPTDVRTLRSRTTNTYDQGKPDGATYHLLTTTVTEGVDPDTGQSLDAVSTVTGYDPIDGAPVLGGSSGWVHRQATSVTVDAGQPTATTSTVVYDDRGRVLRSSKPGSTGTDAATTITVLYTAGTNTEISACGDRPEWAGQPCQTYAAGAVTGHDTTRAAGALPVKSVTGYNKWGSPTTVTETATGPVNGSTQTLTRTSTTTYDGADRVQTVTITGTGTGAGTALTTTRSIYDPATGDVTQVQSLDATGQVTATISKTFDQLGRLTSYTDSTGATTTSRYDRYGNLTRTTQVIAGVSTTTDFTYDRAVDARGYVTAITDSVAGTITPTWGPDGQLLTQTLPGGVTLTIAYDPARVPTARTYTRTSDQAVIWTDTVIENHRGQWITHTATTGTATYGYDRLGRLTSVTDANAGTATCTTRAYGYDANPRTNRTQSATATGAVGDPCPGVTLATTATYDSADRLVSTTSDGTQHWEYDPFGRITTLPTTTSAVTNTYYVNDLIAQQTQPGASRMSWTLDPLQRRSINTQEQWINDTWVESATKTAHYANDSDEPAWIAEDATLPSDVTRYVSGVEGDLAITTSTTGDRVLQLVDLHGDITATLPIDDGATQATWTGIELSRSDGFGNPEPLTGGGSPNAPPQRYTWLGAAQRSAEALGDVILMGVRLYHPTTGRFLTPDPVPGGSANAYDYCNADPVNCTDLNGTFSFRSLLSAVAIVGEIASFIPGPIGAAAAGISAVAYAAQGNTAKAIEMGVTAAAQLIGAGPVVRVAARAVNIARSAGQIAARAAPRVARAATAVRRSANVIRRAACSFTAGTLVVMANGELRPIESLQAGDLVLALDSRTGIAAPQPVLTPVESEGTKHLLGLRTADSEWVVTANHSVWIDGQGWTRAQLVRSGDVVAGLGGTSAKVLAVVDLGFVANAVVHNIVVGSFHTYYVASDDGSTQFLVHNGGPACRIASHGVPRRPGVYVLRYSDGRAAYVGRSINMHARIHRHARSSFTGGFTSVEVYRMSPWRLPYYERAMYNYLKGAGGVSNRILPSLPRGSR